MEDLLSQDDLNALFGGPSKKTTTASNKEIDDFGDLLSQDDLNELLGNLPEKTITVSKNEIDDIENMLSQDDLNALLGNLPEKTITVSKKISIPDMPVEDTDTGGGSMSQEEIDEMLRQFDRDI